MADMKTWRGGCHCKRVSFEVDTDLAMLIACNCSHCQAKGLILTFVPPSQFRLQSGEGDLTEYQFYKKRIHHLFCSSCGMQSFARGKGAKGEDMIAINVRSLEGIELEKLNPRPFNGRAL